MQELDLTQAKCATLTNSLEIFFPEGSDIQAKVNYAKAVCSQCPIAVACFMNKMEESQTETYGIWGMSTPSERKAMANDRKLFQVHLDKLKGKLA